MGHVRLKKQLGFPDAIEAATRAAGDAWTDKAHAAIVAVAGRLDRFTADEVWAELRELAPDNDSRALGGVLRAAARAGYVRKLNGEYRQSTREKRHKGPMQVWESRISVPQGDEK